VVIVINNSDKQVGLYSGGAYIWNEVSVSTCGGLIHGILSKSTHEQGRRNGGGGTGGTCPQIFSKD
jgi:hypothetical protein